MKEDEMGGHMVHVGKRQMYMGFR